MLLFADMLTIAHAVNSMTERNILIPITFFENVGDKFLTGITDWLIKLKNLINSIQTSKSCKYLLTTF